MYSVARISDRMYLLRLGDTETRYFEGLWEIPEGVMYNSYVYTSSEGAVVFDTWKGKWSSEFIEALRGIIDLRDVRYVVVHHMEPDHSGSLKPLVEKTSAVILGHPLVKGMTESFYGLQAKFKPVGDGEKLSIGGETLVFYHTPWLHWPETIMTYIPGEKTLLTCDAFGSYGVFREIWADELSSEAFDKYLWYSKKYFATIIGFYREWVVKNIEKLVTAGVKPEYILPSHGLLLRGEKLEYMVKKYLEWGRGEPERGKILLIYTSMYGFVEDVVGIIKEYFSGKPVKLVSMGFTDTSRVEISNLIGEAYDAENIVFATATYDADVFPLMRHIAHLLARKIPRNKKTAVIALYGWGPRGGKILSEALSDAGFKITGVLEFRAGEAGKNREKIINLLNTLL